jgi:hypothetical protein
MKPLCVNVSEMMTGCSIQTNQEVLSEIKRLFSRYTVEYLVGVSEDHFEANLRSRLGKIDFEIEGYNELELDEQRDLSIKFHWGHDHGFGGFKLKGRY